MNTKKSRKFTSKSKAHSVAKKRKKAMYYVGKDRCGKAIYYVGDFKEAQKIAKK